MDPFENLKSAKSQLDSCFSTCFQEYNSLKDKYEKLQISSNKTSDECKSLKVNLIVSNEKNEELQKQSTIFKNKNEELQKQLTASNAKVEELQKQLATFSKRNEDLQKELTDSGSSLNVALNKNAELEVALNEARTEAKDFKSKIDLVQKNRSKAERKLKKVEKEKDGLKIEYENVRKKLADLLGSIIHNVNKPPSNTHENQCSESDSITLSSDDEDSPSVANTVQSDDKTNVQILKPSGDSTVADVIGVSSNKTNRILQPSPSSISTSPKKQSTAELALKGKEEHNRLTPVLVANVQSTRTNAIVLPKKDSRGVVSSPIFSNLVSSENQSKAKPVLTEGKEKNNQSVAAIVSPKKGIEGDNRSTVSVVTVNEPTQANIRVSPRKDNRSPISSILTTSNNQVKATRALVDRNEGGNHSSSASSVSIQSRPNQTRSTVSPRRDNRDDRRSPISSNLLTSEASTAGKNEGNRPFSTPIAIVQSKLDEAITIISPEKDPICSPVVTSDNQLKVKPVSREANKEDSHRSPTSIVNIQNNQANTSVILRSDSRELRRSPISSFAATSKPQCTTKPVSTDANKESSPLSPTSIVKVQSNQAITSISSKPDNRELRRSPISSSPMTKTQSTTKPISTDGTKEDGRLSSTAIVGAQNNQSIIATPPSKHPRPTYSRPGSPVFTLSPRTPSKIAANLTSGNKGRDGHLSRSSFLVFRAKESQREATDTSKDDNQSTNNIASPSSPIAEKLPSIDILTSNKQTLSSSAENPPTIEVEKPSDLRIPSPSVGELGTPPNANEESSNEKSRPEDMMPLLFPGLQNTPRRNSLDKEDSNSEVMLALDDGDESSSQTSSSHSVPSSSAKFSVKIDKFPIVCLSRIEVPDSLEQALSRETRKNRKSFQEDVAGPSKRRKSQSDQTQKSRRKSDVDQQSNTYSPLRPSRISQRQVKHKIKCLICKKQRRSDNEYQTNTELDDHILNSHPNLKSFYIRCPYNKGKCRRHFKLLKSLRTHAQSRHQGEVLYMESSKQRLWSCSSCSLLFTCNSDLNQHIFRQHLGSKKATKFHSHFFNKI